MNPKILLVGCGKMGGGLLEGLISSKNFNSEIEVLDPFISKKNKDFLINNNINFFDSLEKKSKSSYQVTIIATKPTIYENVLSDLKNNIL